VESFAHPFRPGPRLLRQSRLKLQLGRGQDQTEAQLSRWLGQSGESQGFGFGAGYAGEAGAIAVHQAEATVRATVAGDRDAGGAEGFDIAVDRARRDFQGSGQRFGAHPATVLQRQHNG
jgi:hypothetical protein